MCVDTRDKVKVGNSQRSHTCERMFSSVYFLK